MTLNTKKYCAHVMIDDELTSLSIIKPQSHEYKNKYHVLIENAWGEVGIRTLTIPEIAHNFGIIITDLEESLPTW